MIDSSQQTRMVSLRRLGTERAKVYRVKTGRSWEDVAIIDLRMDLGIKECRTILRECGLVQPTHKLAAKFADQYRDVAVAQQYHDSRVAGGKKLFVLFPHQARRNESGTLCVSHIERNGNGCELVESEADDVFEAKYCVLAGVLPKKS